MLRCKIVNAPIKSNHKLGNKNKEPMADWGIHKRIVGKLIYLSNTRLDIAYAISVVSQFIHSPLKSHMEVVHRIIIYLKTTLGKGITFQKNDDFKLGAYTNANWSSSMVDKRSTTRYYIFLRGNLVTWRSKKLVVVKSNAEAEFRAMAHNICEIL